MSEADEGAGAIIAPTAPTTAQKMVMSPPPAPAPVSAPATPEKTPGPANRRLTYVGGATSFFDGATRRTWVRGETDDASQEESDRLTIRYPDSWVVERTGE